MSFANSPLCTVDVMSLKPSRFLLEAERRLPYRDENGKVHVALCKRSAGELDGVPDEVAAKLRKWVSHAERWAKSAEAPAWSRGADGVWRVKLPATAATKTPATISFKGSDGSTASLKDVLFGDVILCSGQSNMQYTPHSMAGMNNLTAELAAADSYSDSIRFFSKMVILSRFACCPSR